MHPNQLVVLFGPSGVGKTTLANKLKERRPDIHIAVTHTTRNPRAEETHGVHYHFVSPEKFESMVQNGELLEYAEYPPGSGVYYGSSRSETEKKLRVILIVEIQGVKSIRLLRPDAMFVFLQPPNITSLQRRLIARGKDSIEAIERRLDHAQEEMQEGPTISDRIIKNNDGPQGLSSALGELESVFS